VANFLPRSIVVTMLVSFTISFAVMYGQRKAQESSVPFVDATPNLPRSAPTAVPAPAAPPIAEHQGPTAPASRPVARANRPAEAVMPSEEAPAEALPVAFHIRNRRDLNKIDGDIRNITSKPMSITLRAVNASTQATSEIHFQLAPGERRTYSTDDGLYMQTDDQLIAQSPPYQDRVVRVP
jgi:hypothetical protein